MTVLEKGQQQFIQPMLTFNHQGKKLLTTETAKRIPVVGSHYQAIRM
jgi:hypothetical protein